MLIHAVEGQGGEELNENYHEAAREPKDHWTVRSGGQQTQPQEFEQKVVGFVDDASSRAIDNAS